LAVQEQEIEGEEHKLIGSALVHGCLEPAEDGHPISAQRAQLAVQVG
jgi:hypothetical protein